MTLAAVLAARDPRDIAFITDAIAEPVPGKIYEYQSGVEVAGHGECCYLRGTSTLAGSCTNLHETLIRLIDVMRVPLSEAVAMVSAIPAKVTRIDDQVGMLKPGLKADMVLIDSEMNIEKTIICGEVCFDSASLLDTKLLNSEMTATSKKRDSPIGGMETI